MPLVRDRLPVLIITHGFRRSFPVAADAVIFKGAQVATNATGYLVPASEDDTLTIQGTSEDAVDNTGGDDGDLRCHVVTYPSKFRNSAGLDAITIADVGSPCYAVDDETVALTDDGGDRPLAGTVHQVESDGVFVRPPGF